MIILALIHLLAFLRRHEFPFVRPIIMQTDASDFLWLTVMQSCTHRLQIHASIDVSRGLFKMY